MVREIENIDEFNASINVDELVIIDFYAKWCKPCITLGPTFDELSGEYKQCKFYKINVDNPKIKSILKLCEIKSLPSICFYRAKEFMKKIEGSNENVIRDNINRFLKKIEI